MKTVFATSWKKSTQPRKQRKYAANASEHTRRNFLSAPLAKELRKQYKTRSMPIRKGDVVEIIVGNNKKHKGKVNGVDNASGRITIDGLERQKREGSKTPISVHASNCTITELTEDKRRLKTHEKPPQKD
tara:strand:+ start:91 stop:480 length:390 start_codon:yes stop_codon:yes gene_type:complete